VDFSSAPRDQFEQPELDLIEQEARVFSSRYRLRWSDVDDLVAEGQLAWWQQRVRYDPRRGASKETFLKIVVRHAFADLLKAEQSQGRMAEQPTRSFDTPLTADSNLTLSDVVADAGNDFRDVVLELDVQVILGRMPSRQRAVIRGVMDGDTITTVAKRLGVHRDTVYEELKVIRRIFRAEGLFD
jgi:RNA polymerase sigma factor (sigma-70 family)